MKSIKEKAIEVFDDQFKQECFEAGANYVLDHLSETMHVSIDAYLKNNLFQMIKELKK